MQISMIKRVNLATDSFVVNVFALARKKYSVILTVNKYKTTNQTIIANFDILIFISSIKIEIIDFFIPYVEGIIMIK